MQEHADISDDQLPTIAFLRYKKLIDSEREIYECKFEYFKAKRDSRTKTDIVGEKRARKINEKNSRAIQKGLEDEAEPYAATLPLDQAEVPHATQISDDYQKVPK